MLILDGELCCLEEYSETWQGGPQPGGANRTAAACRRATGCSHTGCPTVGSVEDEDTAGSMAHIMYR